MISKSKRVFVTGFIIGAITVGYGVSLLAKSASKVWVDNYILRVSADINKRSVIAYKNKKPTLSRDLLISSLIARSYISNSDKLKYWPVEMPIWELIGKLSGGTKMLASIQEQMFYEQYCALVAINTEMENLNEANRWFDELNSQYHDRHIDRNNCVAIGELVYNE